MPLIYAHLRRDWRVRRDGDFVGDFLSTVAPSVDRCGTCDRYQYACLSSPIALLAARGGPVHDSVQSRAEDLMAPDLLVASAVVADPRHARGVRHRLVRVLAAAVCAVLAGARAYVGIAEWAHDLPVSVRVRIGVGPRAPSESTFRRVLQSVDVDELDRVVSGWLADRAAAATAAGTVRAVAVDGKTARGSRTPERAARHLFAGLRPRQRDGAGSKRGR